MVLAQYRDGDVLSRMPAILSSAISFIEYITTERTLLITFKGGRTYSYFDVPLEVYEEFLRSASKGTYFNEIIRDKYAVI